ncbi:hypothetical protein JK361_39630 [Streptomyces sp. 5-8]|uniref:Oxidoreductase n=1 Tax=Streptomyces musisoli TaxID=2802280 RepID=A0ABS1PDX9_9ACTN|nr:hypothetical protein [Streptomyces musisoli]MBL1110586.1 hypothetical protein [Streptomyces musisoli]
MKTILSPLTGSPSSSVRFAVTESDIRLDSLPDPSEVVRMVAFGPLG